jgi:hypothetical protein
MIIDGKIKLKNGNISRITEKEIEFEDGNTLAADVIVCATGYNELFNWYIILLTRPSAATITAAMDTVRCLGRRLPLRCASRCISAQMERYLALGESPAFQDYGL